MHPTLRGWLAVPHRTDSRSNISASSDPWRDGDRPFGQELSPDGDELRHMVATWRVNSVHPSPSCD